MNRTIEQTPWTSVAAVAATVEQLPESERQRPHVVHLAAMVVIVCGFAGAAVAIAIHRPDGAATAGAQSAKPDEDVFHAPIYAVSYAPQAAKVVLRRFPQELEIRDMAAGATAPRITPHIDAGNVASVAISADGQTLAVAYADGRVMLHQGAEQNQSRVLQSPREPHCASVAMSSAGDIVATGDFEGVVRLWDAATGRLRCEKHVAATQIRSVQFSDDLSRLISIDLDGHVVIHKTSDLSIVSRLPKSSDFVMGADFLDGTRSVVTVTFEGTIESWDVEAGRRTWTVRSPLSPVLAVQASPDQQTFAVGSECGVILWDVEAKEIVGGFFGHEDNVRHVEFIDDGSRLLSASHDGTVRIWDVESGSELHQFH